MYCIALSSVFYNQTTSHAHLTLTLKHLTLSSIVHFTVVCLVTLPFSGSEAGVDLVLITGPSYFSHVNHVVLMLTSLYLHSKSRLVCIKTRSTPASLSLKAGSQSTQL